MLVTRIVDRIRDLAAEGFAPPKQPRPSGSAAARRGAPAMAVRCDPETPDMSTTGNGPGAEYAVLADAEARLRESPLLAECPIHCQFRDGTLTLCGRVPRYSLKQAARSLVDGIPGVEAVDNRIDVIPLPITEGSI